MFQILSLHFLFFVRLFEVYILWVSSRNALLGVTDLSMDGYSQKAPHLLIVKEVRVLTINVKLSCRKYLKGNAGLEFLNICHSGGFSFLSGLHGAMTRCRWFFSQKNEKTCAHFSDLCLSDKMLLEDSFIWKMLIPELLVSTADVNYDCILHHMYPDLKFLDKLI